MGEWPLLPPAQGGFQVTERALPSYPPGTPNWIELAVPDTAQAAEFYARLFAWEVGAPSNAGGGYRMFLQDGQAVAGLMTLPEARSAASWRTYVCVEDLEATLEAIRGAGGEIRMGPLEVLDQGAMAYVSDPTGAVFGLWRPGAFTGAGLIKAPVSLVWSDVLSRDGNATRAFYATVFGWRGVTPSFISDGSYTVFERPDGQAIGGTVEMTDDWFAPEIQPHWAVTLAVLDADATVARATELGAQITQAPMECPVGRFATLTDPQGASFSVMASAPR